MSHRSHFKTSAVIAAMASSVRVAGRTVGAYSDIITQATVASCNGSDPITFKHGYCPNFINCMMNALPPATTSGFQSGGNIAALVPTILALIGSPPLELVQLAFISPQRAIATCLFSIGLPTTLFRQLRPKLPELADRNPEDPLKREWVIPLSSFKYSSTQRFVQRAVADVTIVGLAAIMLWRNWIVNTQTMITWRCEYFWLLFCWPFSCLLWLAISVGLLLSFNKKISFKYAAKGEKEVRSTFGELFMLPYRNPRIKVKAGGEDPGEVTPAAALPQGPVTGNPHSVIASGSDVDAITYTVPGQLNQRHQTNETDNTGNSAVVQGGGQDKGKFIVRITMPTEYGLRSWRWYEAIIEALAVGIYLYATFVLTSILFLSGEEGIIYAVVMVLSLSAARIIEAIC